MKKWLVIIMVIVGIFSYWLSSHLPKSQPLVIYADPVKHTWEVQSIDTMKYSRDVAYEKLSDMNFNVEIERQVKAIADTGATHVAIATPYDEKFYPFLKRWVDTARRHNLNVWFRGNWSSWEGWFGYAKNMTRVEHIQKTKDFILNHPNLFVDGDIFSGCPECENGGPGDPRLTGDVVGHRDFLIDEYSATKEAFDAIHKQVQSNFFSMNGDVARLVMDKKTTVALDGIVTIDHYVATPEQFAKDIHSITQSSGGRVMIGEWGVAIPDIHGSMTDDARAQWMDQAMGTVSSFGKEVVGMNYWLAVGGGTELWSQGTQTSKLSETLRKYYAPQVVYGRVADELGQSVVGAEISFANTKIESDDNGRFEIRSFDAVHEVTIDSNGYVPVKIAITKSFQKANIILIKSEKDSSFKFFLWLRQLGWIQ
jgi:hypothetical protein